MKYNILVTLFALIIFSSTVGAQINKPSLSPRVNTEQQVGLAKVHLDYGQPNKQGRTIFGKLIPYGKLWRTGANASTKMSIDSDVVLGGATIPKGEYSIYTIPNENEWTIIINADTKLWGAAGYDKEKDVARFKVVPIKLKDSRATFQIHFEAFHANGAEMVIVWENTKVSFPLFVDSDAKILQEIEQKITHATGEIKAQTYFDAAQFYYFKKIDLKKAETWFEKATTLRPEAFWYTYYKAELAYTLNKMDIAKKAAKECLEAAKKSAMTSSDYGYIAKATLLLEKINNE